MMKTADLRVRDIFFVNAARKTNGRSIEQKTKIGQVHSTPNLIHIRQVINYLLVWLRTRKTYGLSCAIELFILYN